MQGWRDCGPGAAAVVQGCEISDSEGSAQQGMTALDFAEDVDGWRTGSMSSGCRRPGVSCAALKDVVALLLKNGAQRGTAPHFGLGLPGHPLVERSRILHSIVWAGTQVFHFEGIIQLGCFKQAFALNTLSRGPLVSLLKGSILVLISGISVAAFGTRPRCGYTQ